MFSSRVNLNIIDYQILKLTASGEHPDVGPSIFVCDVEHTSFHFGLCGRKFVLCLFGQCPGLCTICHNWQHTGVVHLSLQADGKVAFEDIPVFGVCRPACHDSSLYLFVLVLFLEAVMLSGRGQNSYRYNLHCETNEMVLGRTY